MKPDSSSTANSVFSIGGVARDAEEVGVRGDRAHELGRVAARLELLQRDPRMAGLEVGMALVVEVVQQPGDAPQLLVLAEAPRVGAHGGLDGQHVLAKRRRLGPLAEEGPGLRARKLERHGWYPSPASGADRRPPDPSAPTPHGEVRHRRRRAAVRHRRARREQERGPAAPGRVPAHGRARSCSTTCRGSATPRRCSTLLEDLGVKVERRDGNTVAPAGRRDPHAPTSTPTSPSGSAPPCWSAGRCSPASAPRCCRRPAAT